MMDSSNVVEGSKHVNKSTKPTPKVRKSTYGKRRPSSKKRPISVVHHNSIKVIDHHDHHSLSGHSDVEDMNSDSNVPVPIPMPRGGNLRFNNILREMYETERDYLTSLGEIIDGYQRQLQNHVTEDELIMIFGNIDDLYDFHVELGADIELYYHSKPDLIGEVFVKMGLRRFMVYEKYYLDHMKSLSFLLQKQEDSDFLAMLVNCQTAIGHQLPLADYLLKPVQRLLKYPLLLQEMIKHAGEESEGRESLLEASKLLKDVADNINEIKRKLDVSKYVESLQKRLLSWDGPDLVTFGCLKDAGDFKVSDSSNKKSLRQVLLFELGILICKPRAQGFVSVKHYFKMDDLYLQTMLNEALCFRLTLAHNKKVYFTFYCKNQEDKQYWIAKIKKVIIDFHTQGKKPKPPPPSTKPTKGKHNRRTTGRKRYSSAAQPIEKAPVGKKRIEDQKLMHNPYAQAGGFEGDAPDVKHLDRKEISKSRANSVQRNSSNRYNDRHSYSDDAHARKGNRGGSKRYSSRPTSEIYDDGAATEQKQQVEKQLAQEQEQKQQEKTQLAHEQEQLQEQQHQQLQQQQVEAKRLSESHGKEENEERVCVVRCNFPDKTHTSVIVKTGDTMRKALSARLARRELKSTECIILVPAEPSLVIGWDDEAIKALQGHTMIRMTKIKGSPQKLSKGSVVRVPSGNILIVNDDTTTNEGVVKTSPTSKGSRKSLNLNASGDVLVCDEPIVIQPPKRLVFDDEDECDGASTNGSTATQEQIASVNGDTMQQSSPNVSMTLNRDDGINTTFSSSGMPPTTTLPQNESNAVTNTTDVVASAATSHTHRHDDAMITPDSDQDPNPQTVESNSTTAAAGSLYFPSNGPKPKFPMRMKAWRQSTKGNKPDMDQPSATSTQEPVPVQMQAPTTDIPTDDKTPVDNTSPEETTDDGHVEDKIEQFGGAPKRSSSIKPPSGSETSNSIKNQAPSQQVTQITTVDENAQVETDTSLGPVEDVSNLARKFSNKCKVQPGVDEGSIRYRTKQPQSGVISPTKHKHSEVASPPVPRRRSTRPMSQYVGSHSSSSAAANPQPSKRNSSKSMKGGGVPAVGAVGAETQFDFGKVVLRRGSQTKGSGKINVKRWDSAETHRSSRGEDQHRNSNGEDQQERPNSGTQDKKRRSNRVSQSDDSRRSSTSTNPSSPASTRASWRQSAYEVVGLGGVRTAKAIQNRPVPVPRNRATSTKIRPPPKNSFDQHGRASVKAAIRPPAVSDFGGRKEEGSSGNGSGISTHRESVKHKIAQFGGSIKVQDPGNSKQVRTLAAPLTPRHTDV